jgi:hypothetical protein
MLIDKVNVEATFFSKESILNWQQLYYIAAAINWLSCENRLWYHVG